MSTLRSRSDAMRQHPSRANLKLTGAYRRVTISCHLLLLQRKRLRKINKKNLFHRGRLSTFRNQSRASESLDTLPDMLHSGSRSIVTYLSYGNDGWARIELLVMTFWIRAGGDYNRYWNEADDRIVMHVSVTHLDRLSPSYAYALGNLCGITLCIIQNSSDVRLI